MNEIDMGAIHAVELDMLKAVTRLCDEHSLRYSLYCGTLLGAVRHKGFIPWDDDVDLVMPLKDYRKFQKVCHELPERFSCIYYDNTPNAYWLWTRVVANGTTFLPLLDGALDVPWGIFLDIYPMIGAAKTQFGVKLQDKLLLLARRLRTVDLYRAIKDKGIIKQILYRIPFPVRRAVSDLILRLVMKDPKKSSRIGTVDAAPFRGKFDLEDWKEMTRLPFEDAEFSAPAKYDKLLHIMYCDYMRIPPQRARKPHFLKDRKQEYIVDPHRDYRLYRQELYGK